MYHCEFHAAEVLGEGLSVRRVLARESISQPYNVQIDLLWPDDQAPDLDLIVGCHGTLRITDQGRAAPRLIHGIVAEAHVRWGAELEQRLLRLTLVPRVWRLGMVRTMAAFVNSSFVDIIEQKLRNFGLGDETAIERRLTADYPAREFMVQYNETDLAFLSRRCEHQGISYFFRQTDQNDVLVFCDDNVGFPASDEDPVPFRTRGELLDVYQIERQRRLVQSSHIVHDYDYRAPAMDLCAHGQVEGDGGGTYHYGNHSLTPDESQRLATIRAQEQAALKDVYQGESTCIGFSAGHWFELVDHPLHVGRFLLLEVEHELVQSVAGGTGEGDFYRNRWRAIPRDQPYRPPRLTPQPRITGLIHGIVETATGEASASQPQLDGDGRYTVRLLFDQTFAEGQPASHPMRRIQTLAGSHYGVHMPLHPGTEVLVAFIDGNPDRPVIVGAVPNALTPSPVTAQEAHKSRIRSASGILIEMVDP